MGERAGEAMSEYRELVDGDTATLGWKLLEKSDDIERLWKAADAALADGNRKTIHELYDSVEALRPLFGKQVKK